MLRIRRKATVGICVRVFVCLLHGQDLPVPGTAVISGTAVGDDGKPVSAVITAIKVDVPVSRGRAESAADGSFSLSGLLDGTYNLCAVDKGGSYLDPCAWSIVLPAIAVSAKAPVSAYNLVMSKGSLLQVRVNDASQLLDTATAALNQTSPVLVLAVVTARHTLQPLSLMSKDATGQNQQTAIPANTSIALGVMGRGITITDSTGKALDLVRGVAVSVQAANGQSAPPVTLTVTAVTP